MEKKIRIVFLCRDYGRVNRGVESHVKELSEKLKNKFEIEIFSGKDSDNLKKIISGRFDLVIPTNGRMQALKVSLGRIAGGYKTLIAAHAGIGKDEIWNLLMMPNVYVALTASEMNWAGKFLLNSKLVKIPNGIDLKKFTPSGNKLDLNLEQPVILSVGALDWYKYHDLAVRAVSKLEKGSLLIVGRGPEKAKLEEMGNRLLGPKKFTIMEVDYHKMPDVYRSADLFTLASWSREAFGIVYLEAMAANLPVVAPNDLSRNEIVGNAGILVDVFDEAKYTKALGDVLIKKWGNIPRQQAEKFSWEKIAGEYEELIKEICQ